MFEIKWVCDKCGAINNDMAAIGEEVIIGCDKCGKGMAIVIGAEDI